MVETMSSRTMMILSLVKNVSDECNQETKSFSKVESTKFSQQNEPLVDNSDITLPEEPCAVIVDMEPMEPLMNPVPDAVSKETPDVLTNFTQFLSDTGYDENKQLQLLLNDEIPVHRVLRVDNHTLTELASDELDSEMSLEENHKENEGMEENDQELTVQEVLDKVTTEDVLERDDLSKDPDFVIAEEDPNESALMAKYKTKTVSEKRNLAKQRRLKGKTYEGYERSKDKVITNTSRPAKRMNIRCGHKLPEKITDKSFLCASLTEEDRQREFDKIWKLSSWNEKKLFVSNLVITRQVRRRRKKMVKDGPKKKNEGHDYYLTTITGKRVKVCRTMFLNTLCIGEDCVKRWVKQLRTLSESSNDTTNSDNLALNAIQSIRKITPRRRKSENLLNTVRMWLDKIPKVPSHYCRGTSSMQYVDNALISKQNMFKIFKSWCVENKKEATNLKAFKSVLTEKKISIHKPRKDQCDTCVGFKCRSVSEEVYNSHREKEKAGREAKARMKSAASETNLVVTMDLQSVLTCPKLLASQSYYKLKLQLHNFTIYALNDKTVNLYVWHEANGGVTSNEFTSCVIDYLSMNLSKSKDLKSFVLISDGCNYQNRNKILASALNDFATENEITIRQLFLEKGHTMMEADSVHSALEHYFYPPINSPMDYVSRMRMARPNNPYNIKVLDYTFFKKYDIPSNFSSIRPGKRVRDPVVVDIRQLLYLPDGKVMYSLDYSENFTELPYRRKTHNTSRYNISLHKKQLPISDEKYKHLQELKSVIEMDHHTFYDALPHQKKQQ